MVNVEMLCVYVSECICSSTICVTRINVNFLSIVKYVTILIQNVLFYFDVPRNRIEFRHVQERCFLSYYYAALSLSCQFSSHPSSQSSTLYSWIKVKEEMMQMCACPGLSVCLWVYTK